MTDAGGGTSARLQDDMVTDKSKVEDCDSQTFEGQLHHYVSHNDLPALDSFMALHKGNLDINKPVNGMTPLCLATKLGHKSICRFLLLQEGIDVNKATAECENAVLLAIKNRDTEILGMLLDAGANSDLPEPQGDIATPLYNAVWKGQRDMVAMLIESGCDVNKGSKRLYSPLLMATRTGNMHLVRMLTKAACDVNAQNKFGVTPLYEAVLRDNPKIVEALISAGCCVNISEEYGITPLYLAVKEEKPEIVKLLLQAGADILKESHGETPTTMAAFKYRNKSLKLLLQRGAELGIVPHRPEILMNILMKAVLLPHASLDENPQIETADILLRAHSMHKLPLEPEIISTITVFSHLAVLAILAGILDASDVPVEAKLLCPEHDSFIRQAKIQPLCLKELARISIRLQCGIRTLWTIPQLPVPKSAQEYLLFDDDNKLHELPNNL